MRWIIAPDFDVVEPPHRFLPVNAAGQVRERGDSNPAELEDKENDVLALSRTRRVAWSATLQGDPPFLYLLTFVSITDRLIRLGYLRFSYNRHHTLSTLP